MYVVNSLMNQMICMYQVQKYYINGFWVRRMQNLEKLKAIHLESTSTGGQPIESWAMIWGSELGARGVWFVIHTLEILRTAKSCRYTGLPT